MSRPTSESPKTSSGFFFASNREPFTIVFDAEVPEIDVSDYETAYRGRYSECARRLADVLEKNAPGGLVDALFGELAARKASIFRVASPIKGGRS